MTLCSPWITETDLVECGCPASHSKEVTEQQIEAASTILYYLSGQQFPGVCSEWVRPSTSPSSGYSAWPYPWMPLQVSPGVWINIGFCGCDLGSCGCPPIPRIDLGRDDVISVEQVWQAGELLDPSLYRLDHNRYLSRLSGAWPCCQDLRGELTAVNTYGAQITFGRLPDAAGINAARALSHEMLKACDGARDCRLPKRAQSITRQGVTVDFLDPMEFLTDGRTGIYEVDLWLSTVNPHGLRQPSVVWSPELASCDLRYPVEVVS